MKACRDAWKRTLWVESGHGSKIFSTVISSSWGRTTVLTCNSSAHFQPIQNVVWEASMSKGCFVREAGTETSFTIFAFHCKSNLSKILTCKIPSPSHWHFFSGMRNFSRVGGRISLEVTFVEQRAKGCKQYREISIAFSFNFFPTIPHEIEWHILISFCIGVKPRYPCFLQTLFSSDDECCTNSAGIINRFLISF